MEFIISELVNKNILILGLGVSGLSMARWCVRNGATVTVVDTRKEPPNLKILQTDFPQIIFQGGTLLDEKLLQCNVFDAVLFSPGLSLSQCHPIHESAKICGVACDNEVGLFSQALASLHLSQNYSPKVIAITGTNGKTTVTSMTGKLVENAGKRVATAGNIGPALLATLLERLCTNNLPEVWVLELSSFQLDGMGHSSEFNKSVFVPTVATVLNISQDHLDWHQSMENYLAAKYRIYGGTTLPLLNRDDPLCRMLSVHQAFNNPFITFGQDEPQRPGDWGIENVNGINWLARVDVTEKNTASSNGKPKKLSNSFSAQNASLIKLNRLMPVEALKIHGRHNASNALAALALAGSVGCALAPMLHALKIYEGEPHRVQWVDTIQGIDFFDDSKGTNIGATVAALEGMVGVGNQKLILIMGGDGKGQDFSLLKIPLQNCARAVILIGRDADLIHQSIQPDIPPLPSLPTVHHAASLPEAVWIAASLAQMGDTVLLSPACASLDMFDGYQHRAAVFREAVQSWKLEKQKFS